MRYQRVLIDLDDTLFDFQTGNRIAIHALMEELGLQSETVYDEYQAINHQCWQALERGEMTQETLHVERFRRFLQSKEREDDPEAVASRFACLLGQQVFPLPFAEQLVQTLSQHVPVVLLTNGIAAVQRSRLARSPLRNWISEIVISQEAGISKPDPEIFRRALGGVAPRNGLMIGDGIYSDLRGANLAGVDVCWYNPRRLSLPEGIHAEYTVRSLKECLPIALMPDR